MADIKYYDVILKPVVTEKSMAGMGDKKYTFLVHPDATKTQIKDAVRKLFNVKVVSCTTMNVRGKEKRLRGRPGFTSSYKKAVVRLAKGETIKVFEGV